MSAHAKRKLKRLNSKKKVNLTQNKMNYNSWGLLFLLGCKKSQKIRMHSSRMRTGHALTVLGGEGGWRVCIPEEFFWGENKLKKKKKKISDTPSPKFGADTPHPPTPPKIWSRQPPPPPCGQTDACKLITLAQLRCGR